jgi:hypothetical protein
MTFPSRVRALGAGDHPRTGLEVVDPLSVNHRRIAT